MSKLWSSIFKNDVVVEAREMLGRKYGLKLDELDIMKFTTRRFSSNRSCCEANARDVTDAVHLLMNSERRPTFAVKDLTLLLLLRPALVILRSQTESIALLEIKCKKLS